jgi:hypothetical protein
MHGKGIIVACLLMGKLALAKVTQWLAMDRIKVSYLLHAVKFSKGLVKMKIKI